MLVRTLDRARGLARRSVTALERLFEEPTPATAPEGSAAPAKTDAIAALSARVDRMTESFDALRRRFEADQQAWQKRADDEARLREARVLDHLATSLSRASVELFDSQGSLRPPRVPSDWSERPTMSPAPSVDGSAAPPGPTVRGPIDGMSLSTLLGAFELERRDGVFQLSGREGAVEFDLRRGAIVQARVDGVATNVVAALARAFDFGEADFKFLRIAVTADSDAPRSLNGLLLEVFQQRDESRRAR